MNETLTEGQIHYRRYKDLHIQYRLAHKEEQKKLNKLTMLLEDKL